MADPADPAAHRLLPLDAGARRWVDSVLASLDTRGRAAQLVFPWMWGRYVPEEHDEWTRLRGWVQRAGVGGIITSIGPPVALADKLNRLQLMADVPLLIAADMEHGPGQRLDGGTLLPWGVDMGGGTSFPPAMAFGATGDPSLAYAMARVTAAEARAVGIHMNFAPVVDVNNNPANPIINVRSYGGEATAVAAFGVAQLRGLQDHGMLATAKHFPGHGDVEHDTHLVPLVLRIDAARADSVELVPYRAAIEAGVAGVMSAHIAVPALSGDSILPATLAPRMLDSLLAGELGFEGLVVTDALDMGAIVQRFGPGEAAVLALEAGADILLQPVDPFVTIEAVVAAVRDGRIPAARLERSVRKVLQAKARAGLPRERTVPVDGVARVVGAPAHRALADSVADASITLVRDREGLVPLRPLRQRRVLLVTYTDQVAPFTGRVLARELVAGIERVDRVALGPEPPTGEALDSLRGRADSADLVILAAAARVRGDRASAIDTATAVAMRDIAATRPTILVSLGSPYLLQEIPAVGTYLLGWSGADVSQAAVARALLGSSGITGRLPISIPPLHERGSGVQRDPYPAGHHPPVVDSTSAAEISAKFRAAIAAGVTPGAVVAIGTSQSAPWVRAFGRIDWDAESAPVTDSTLYDLASLTKVVGTTTALMLLVDRGRISLEAPLSRYLPAWPEGGWQDQVTIRRLLTHTAGLAPFVPFWHPAEGALRGRDAVIDAIARRPPAWPPGSRYAYSDLGAILLGAAAETVAGMPLDAFLAADVWRPLGMRHTGFNPRRKAEPTAGVDTGAAGVRTVPLHRIAPTEVDSVFRDVHVHGVVHDENAWAMGGVAGHAGLFSTGADLARFARMILRGGVADDGPRLLQTRTVARFTRPQPGLGRALGWDASSGTGIAEPFSPAAFGHTGFTGTSLWIDPEHDLYVVILTNRVNPTREGRGIGELRRDVHRAAAQGMGRVGGGGS